MDEGAGLCVASCVDVEVAAGACDAATCILAVIPEVCEEDGHILAPVVAHLVIHALTLLCRGEKLDRRAQADRHVREDPGEEHALVDEELDVFVRSDGVIVLGRVADGGAERKPALAEQVHSTDDLVVGAGAAAGVGCLAVAFNREGRHKVLHAQDLVCELLVDERAVREGAEVAVRVLLAEADKVLLAQCRLAAREEVDVGAELHALRDDGVKLIEREGLLLGVRVVRSPAAVAVEVAGRRRVHEDGPGAVAAFLLVDLALAVATERDGVHEEVLHERAGDFLVDVIDNVLDKTAPVVVRILHEAHDHVEQTQLCCIDVVA